MEKKYTKTFFKKITAISLAVMTILTTGSANLTVFAQTYGSTGGTGASAATLDSGGYLAEVYTANPTGSTSGKGETLKDVSFTLDIPANVNISYTVSIHQNLSADEAAYAPAGGTTTYTSGTQTITGQTDPQTAHKETFSIPSTAGLYLSEGEQFSIVIQLTSSNGSKIDYYSATTTNGTGFFSQSSATGWETTDGDIFAVTTNDNASEPDDVTKITLADTKTALAPGESVQLSPTLTPDLKRTVTYSVSGDTGALSVDENGKVTASTTTTGTATVTATVGTKTASRTFYVLTSALSDPSATYTYTGKRQKPSIKITYGSTTKELTSTTADDSFSVAYGANVNAGDGSGSVTVTGKSGTAFAGYTNTLTFSIGKMALTQSMIDAGTFTIKTSDSTVTAASQITDSNGNNLTLGTDFTATATQTAADTSSVTYSVTVTGTGNYSGVITRSAYKVNANQSGSSLIDIADILSMSLNTTSFTYTGEAQDAGYTLKYKSTGTDATDFITAQNATVSYTNDVNAGTATLTITGVASKGYTGTLTETYTIAQNDLSKNTKASMSAAGDISVSLTGTGLKSYTDSEGTVYYYYIYDGTAKTPSINGLLMKNTSKATYQMTEGTDYTLKYSSNNTDITGLSDSALLTVSGKGNFTGNLKLKYYIIGRFGQDAALTVGNKATSYSASTTPHYISSYTAEYNNGSTIDPAIAISIGGVSLNNGSEYSVTYADDINAGTATATITGLGIYSQQDPYTVTYTIGKKTMSGSFAISNSDTSSWVYTGKAITLSDAGTDKTTYTKKSGISYDVTYDGRTLTEGTDYILSYANNTNAGTATVTATGQGNYAGTMTGSFTISARAITSDTKITTATIEDQQYTGSQITPAVQLYYDGNLLSADDNYTLSYGTNTAVGANSGTITITGKNNLTGSRVVTFNIVAKTMKSLTYRIGSESLTFSSGDTQTTKDSNYKTTYTGNAIKPAILVYDGSTKLTNNKDYTLGYANNVDAGSTNGASVTITGKTGSNYAGSSVTITYTISPRDISNIAFTQDYTQGTDGTYVDSTTSKHTPYLKATDSGLSLSNQTRSAYDSSTKKGDYSLEVTKGGTTAGTANEVTLTGTNNYTGTQTVSYTVGTDISSLVSATLKNPNDNTTYTKDAGGTYQISYLGNIRPALEVGLTTGKSLTEGTDYTVSYTNTTTKETESKSTVTAATTDAGSTITATITAKGDTYYGTSTVAYKINQADITATLNYDSTNKQLTGTAANGAIAVTGDSNFTMDTAGNFARTYDKSSHPAAPVLSYTPTGATTGNKVATYSLSYTSPAGAVLNTIPAGAIAADTYYTVTATGTGNYTGTITLKYRVNPVDISTISSDTAAAARVKYIKIPTHAYTGSPITPGLMIYDSGIVDESNTGNTSKVSFTINNITDTYTIPTDSNGKNQTAGYTMLSGSYASDGTDFDASIANNTAIGTATVTLTGKGNYTGVGTITFDINAITITDATVSKVPDQSYTGTEISLANLVSTGALTVTKGSQVLTYCTDYTLSYENQTGTYPGTAKVLVTGTGNYNGTVETTFNIKADITSSLFTKTGPDMVNGYTLPSPTGTIASDVYDAVSIATSDGKTTLSRVNDASQNGYMVSLSSGCATPGNSGTITITGTGVYTGTITYTKVPVYGNLADANVSLSASSLDYTGQNADISAAVTYGKQTLTQGNDYVISTDSYKKAVGTHTVTIQPASGSFYKNENTKASYSIKYNLEDATVTGISSKYDYTGAAQAPTPTVTVGGQALTVGTSETDTTADCYVTYTGNTTTKGTVTVTILPTTKGTAVGKYTTTYDITAIALTASNTEISTIDAQPYTGNAIKPDVTVQYTGGSSKITLTKGTDYTVSYSNNTNASETAPTVTITGTGNYTGSLTKTFIISKVDISSNSGMDISVTNPYWAGANNKVYPGYTLKFNSKTLAEGTDYTVTSVTNNTSAMTGTITFTGSGTNFSGSVTKDFTILNRDLQDGAITVSANSSEYNGQAITLSDINLVVSCPTGELNADGTKKTADLVAGVDYTVDISGAGTTIKNVGTYQIQIAGTNKGFTGTLTVNYTVTPRSIDNAKITLDQESQKETNCYSYVSGGVQPTLADTATDKINGTDYTLQEGTDYQISSYVNNTTGGTQDDAVEANRPAVIIKGMGNYAGTTKTIYFSIGDSFANNAIAAGLSLSSDTKGTLATDKTNVTFMYDNKAHDIVGKSSELTAENALLTVTNNGKVLTAGTDYTITNPTDTTDVTYDTDQTTVMPQTVTITGKNGYYGTKTVTVTVTPRTVTKDEITVNLPGLTYSDGKYTATYTGSQITPEATVHDNLYDKDLTKDTDYTVSYGTNTAVSGDLGTVTVTLKKNYASDTNGTFTIPFTILKKNLVSTEFKVNLTPDTVAYTGAAVEPTYTVTTLDGGTTIDAADYTAKYYTAADYAKNGTEATEVTPVNAGKYTVVVTGNGNYSGSIAADFLVVAKLSDATVTYDAYQFYTGSEIDPPVTVTVGGNTIVSTDKTNTDLIFTYASNDSYTKGGYFTVSSNADYYTGTAKNDKYLYTISTSASLLIATGPTGDSFTYTGSPVTISPATVKLTTTGGTEVTYDSSNVTYKDATGGSDHTDAGQVTATITLKNGSGETIGTKDYTYTITPKQLSDSDIEIRQLANDLYTGAALTPEPYIFYNGNQLTGVKTSQAATASTYDYTYAFSNNTYPTTTENPAVVTISAKHTTDSKGNVTYTGNYQGQTTATFQIKPEGIYGLKIAKAAASSLTLAWNKDSNVDGYEVTTNPQAAGSTVYTTTGSSYSVAGLNADTEYTYYVRSFVNYGGTTYYSDYAKITGSTGMPVATVQAASTTEKKAVISWNTNASVKGYRIYRSTSEAGTYTRIADVPVTKGSYTNTGLVSGRTYYYKVQAFKISNGAPVYGDYSAAVAVTVK